MAPPRQNIPLENIRVASPCPANWDDMTGDDKARFCGQCQLNVYNLSAMTKTEAETLVASREGRLCVRYYMRADGTIITSDCPVGVEIKHRKVLKLKRAGVAAAIALVTFAGIFTVKSHAGEIMLPPPEQQPEVLGEMIAPPEQPPKQPLMGKPMNHQPVMGSPPPVITPQENNNNDKEPEKHGPTPRQGKVKMGEPQAFSGEVRGRLLLEMGDVAEPL